MNKMATVQEVLYELNLNKKVLTRQQVLTLRGQALNGDADGAAKGLQTLLKRKKGRSNETHERG